MKNVSVINTKVDLANARLGYLSAYKSTSSAPEGLQIFMMESLCAQKNHSKLI